MPELLVELLSEEIPARMQARAADDFRRLVCERLERAQLSFTRAEAFVTPRRLVLAVDGLPEKQPDLDEERKGPRVGSPEKAVEGFLRAAGLASIDQAEIRETEKGQFYFAVTHKSGRKTADLIGIIVFEAVISFPWPKSMRWASNTLRYVRPLHNILCIFDGAKVRGALILSDPPGMVSDIKRLRNEANEFDEAYLEFNSFTFGHRFLSPGRIEVANAAEYAAKLRGAKVIVDQGERRRVIQAQAEKLAAAEGLQLRDDEALLDEVTGLVEWPVAMLGRIDPAFMDVPPEVLVTAMRAHQKYFSLQDANGKLAPRFVVVANTEGSDGGRAIIAGNERVLRARLSDAKFFWDEDRKRPLASRVEKLAERVFHAKLGSDLQRAQRLARLATAYPDWLKWKWTAYRLDPALAGHAARLAKADLTTAMVGEFPELQGVMGRYYALYDGEADEVADAIADHYAPQGPSDRCPAAPLSVIVALADKADTLAGFFSIGEKPTGSKDPYALRRAGLGIIRIIVENKLRVSLRPLFDCALEAYALRVADQRSIVAELLDFLADRLKVHLREQGVRHDLISAVFGEGGEDDLVRLLARVDALRDFLDTDDGANLLVAYRRASNIVRIEENKDGTSYSGEAEGALLEEQQEKDLHRALAGARDSIASARLGERFGDAMTVLAGLRAPVDAFFDHVQVNCKNAELRVNRLRLLSQIRSALEGVADFSQIEG